MTAPAILTSRNATLPDMVAILRTQRARRLDVVAPATAIHAHEGNLVISGTVQQMTADGVTSAAGAYRPTQVPPSNPLPVTTPAPASARPRHRACQTATFAVRSLSQRKPGGRPMTPGGKRSATNPRRNSEVRHHSRALSEHFITAGARAGPLLTKRQEK
jgi:hypothetical protein